MARQHGLQGIAFPAISTGIYGYPPDEAASIAVQTLRSADTRVELVRLLAFDDEETVKYAVEHRDVVARFGRFPHRNEALGRACTGDEVEYLKDAERYGQ